MAAGRLIIQHAGDGNDAGCPINGKQAASIIGQAEGQRIAIGITGLYLTHHRSRLGILGNRQLRQISLDITVRYCGCQLRVIRAGGLHRDIIDPQVRSGAMLGGIRNPDDHIARRAVNPRFRVCRESESVLNDSVTSMSPVPGQSPPPGRSRLGCRPSGSQGSGHS
ncbi:hypothetical protein MJO57_01795 [Endozoicomonas sp. SCSIO W0465]|nr:hypothetical protein [Endozoicomonas sp. SCSIO W0465]USE39888.1 hypothetical protein MJO57_01795 [Endozoicomonas sp. SCSIO W0465]